ncbi:MAG TPA: class II aldolase/adducin family protein [Planctomycetota bacterium]|jgi:L-fuculose-phosphate aldolase
MSSPSERDMRNLIVKACQGLFQRGLIAATDGNVSARVSATRVLITPSYVSKGEVTAASLLLCDMDGKVVKGCGKASAEVQVHLAAYKAREDVRGVVHAHPPIATAFTFAGQESIFRDPIVPEIIGQIGPIPTAPYLTPGSQALADAVFPLVKECEIVLMAQHGAVTTGKDPWAAYLRMEKLEQLAGILRSAGELAGGLDNIKRLTAEQAADVLRSYGKKT